MGGILKHINCKRLQPLGMESNCSLVAPASLCRRAAGLLGKAVLAGGCRSTALCPCFPPDTVRHTGTGCSLNSSRAGVWNWHTAALLFPSLPEMKHSVQQRELQALCSCRMVPGSAVPYKAAWFALRRDIMAATVLIFISVLFTVLIFISVFHSRFPGACLKLGETPLEVLCT